MRRLKFIFILLFLSPLMVFAQSPAQDCINAIPLCQNSYSFPNGFIGSGIVPNEINSANSCLPTGEENSVWFRFTVETTGNLSFIISPNNASADYNWALFDVTGKTCADIAAGSLEIACNASTSLSNTVGTNGHTGALTGHPYYGFLDPTDAIEMDIPVTQGKTYALNVSNFSGNTNGFSIDFGYSTAVLFNGLSPDFLFIAPVDCGDDELMVHFNKPIRCNTVQPSDFILSGNTVTNVSSLECNQGLPGSMVYKLTLATPISNSGSSFALNLVDSIGDFCGNFTMSDVVNFNVAPVIADAGVDHIFCKGENINIQIGDTSLNNYSNTSFSWAASSALVQNAITNPNAPTPNVILNDIPADTVTLVLTVTTGSCTDQDTVLLYFRDCCKNYDAQISSFQNIGCFGASTGEATATALGSISGFNPSSFTYVWSSSGNAPLATGLSADVTYTVTVTDQLGCSDTASILLSEPASPISVSSTGSILACHGDNTGTILLDVSGATAPYSYVWSNGDTTEDLYNLTAGTYTVTISDGNNCTITQSEDVTQPPTPLIITGTGSTIACGATTGNINISVSGGGSPYTYAWSNGSTAQDIAGLSPGTYTVTVSDQFGCNLPQDFTVNTLTNLTATTTATDAACITSPTGTASVSATGGQAPYSYLWSYNAQTSANLTNLPAGLYTVTITDATNCQITASATVNLAASLSVSASVMPISCNGGNDGAIDLTVLSSDPTNTFSYQWSNSAVSQDLNNLSNGSYSVTVTDQNGCTQSGSFNINEPTALTATVTATDVSCNGGSDGSLNVSALGGTGQYNYQWSNGLGISPVLLGISTGLYTVTVTDGNGCSTTSAGTISEPSALSVSLTPTTVACAGNATGSISTSITGGTTPYSFNWDNGAGSVQSPSNLIAGTYTVTVTDGNGCSTTTSTTINQQASMSVAVQTTTNVTCNGGNDGAIQLNITNGAAPYSFNWTNGVGNIQNPTNLFANTYNVTVTDNNGCTATTTATITEPTALTISAFPVHVQCNGAATGAIGTLQSGGIAPYSYNWSNGLGNSANHFNLAAGNYSVTITDGNGCTASTSTTINQPAALSVTLNSTDLNCNGDANGTISANVTGGVAPYSYAWQNTTSNVPNQSNLIAGTYDLTITDNNGCTINSSTVISEPSQLVATLTGTDVNCFGKHTGSISTNVTGGTQPYSFAWDNGAPNIQSPGGLNANIYTATITDANNCQINSSIVISEPSELNLMPSNITPSTCNNPNGQVVVIAGGGTTPYQYSWSANAGISTNTNTATGLGVGTYFVSVTDANGCLDTINNILFEATPAFQASSLVTSPQCELDNGQIQITGIPSYSYQWSPNANTGNMSFANNLTSGNYTVTISNGVCDTTLSFSLSQPTLLTTSNTVSSASCGQNNGSIAINVNTGTAPYQFDWDIVPSPGNVGYISNLAAGTYRVTITDDEGCEKADAIVVNGTDILDVTTSVVQPDCNQPGSIALNALQGTAPFIFNWSDPSIGNISNPSNLSDGTYEVTVIDAANCETSFMFELETEGAFEINLDNLGNNICPNDLDGFIDISTTSLSPSLQYLWSNNINEQDLDDLAGGTYTVTVTDAISGCTETATYQIEEPDSFTVTVPTNVDIIQGESVLLEAIATSPAVIYSWAGDDGFISGNPMIDVSPTETTVFTLTVNLPSCPPEVYEITVTVSERGDILIPDAFTPNNDGLNDDFFIYARNGLTIKEFKVYNKWGEVMHDDHTRGWDGTHRNSLMQNDSYVYLVKIEYVDGTEEILTGQFLLIR